MRGGAGVASWLAACVGDGRSPPVAPVLWRLGGLGVGCVVPNIKEMMLGRAGRSAICLPASCGAGLELSTPVMPRQLLQFQGVLEAAETNLAFVTLAAHLYLSAVAVGVFLPSVLPRRFAGSPGCPV